MKKELLVSIGIFYRLKSDDSFQPDVWMQRRTDTGALHGKWEFPGGKVEPGESERDALQREIHEELGCHVSVGEILPVVELEAGIRLMPFQCHLTEEAKLLEHADMVWCKKEKFAELDWVAEDISIWSNLLEKG